MAQGVKNKGRYQTLFRFQAGIITTCVIVTIVAGALAGVSVCSIQYYDVFGTKVPFIGGILFRAIAVTLGLYFIARAVTSLWISWEDLQGAGVAIERQKKKEAQE